jgi:hypothetical protein
VLLALVVSQMCYPGSVAGSSSVTNVSPGWWIHKRARWIKEQTLRGNATAAGVGTKVS